MLLLATLYDRRRHHSTKDANRPLHTSNSYFVAILRADGNVVALEDIGFKAVFLTYFPHFAGTVHVYIIMSMLLRVSAGIVCELPYRF